MQKYIFPILILFLFPILAIASNGEQSKLDENIAKHQNKIKDLSGTALLKAYSTITSQEKQNNPDTALHYFSLAITLLEKHTDLITESDLYTNIAWVYITKGKYELAQEHAKIALSKGKKASNYRRQHNATTALGAIALYTGDTGTGLNYFKQALEFSRLGKALENEATSLHNLAMIYTQLGDLDVALEYLTASRDLNLKINKDTAVAVTEAQIAEIYSLMENYEKAIPYLESAISTHEKTNNTFYIAKAKTILARTFRKLNRLDEAQMAIQQAMSILKSTGKGIHLRDELITSGNIYLEQKEYQQAITEYSKAMISAEKVESDDEIQNIALGLAMSHWYLKNNDKALTLAKLSLKKAKKVKNKIAIEEVEARLSQIYASNKDYKSAYQHLLISAGLNETNRKNEVSEKNKQTENRFQTAKKEKQIELLTKDNELQLLELKQIDYERNLWFAGLFILLLSICFIIYRQKKKQQLVHDRANLMAELVEKKNQLLADVSHELRTPLSVLHLKVEALQHNLVKDVDASYNSLLRKIGEINHMISDIYQLAQSDIGALNLDIHSYNCFETLTAWSKEFAETIENNGFTWQESLNIPKDLSLKFDDDKIKQLLSNLIHNSIAYTDKPGRIAISVIILGNNLSMRIEDSSPGVAKEDLTQIFERLFRVESSRSRATGGSGLGLAICRSIIEAHQGSIAATNSKLGGLAITVKLPLLVE